MGKIILFALLVSAITFIIVMLSTSKRKEAESNLDSKKNDATKKEIDELICDLKVKITKLKVESHNGLASAQADLAFYEEQLKEAIELKEKINKSNL